MRELPLYNGAVRQTAQQQFARVQAPHVENMGHMVDGALEQLVGVSDKVIKLHDFGVQQDVEAKQRANDIEAEKEFMRRSALPWGDEESFYLPDGRVNEDVVKRFIAEQQQKNALVEGNYWGGEAKLEHAARIADVNGRLAQKVTIGLAAQENENRKRAFEANYALAVERGDMPGALRALADAERAGQMLPAEVAKRKLALKRQSVRKRQAELRAGGGEGAAQALDELLEVQSTKYKVQSDGDEVQSTKYKVQSDGDEVQSTKDKVQSDGDEVQSTKDKVQSDVGEVQSDGDEGGPASSEVVTPSGYAEARAVEAPALGDEASGENVPLTLDEERLKGVGVAESEHLTLHEALLRDLTEQPPSSVLTPAEFKAELQQSMAVSMAIVPGDFKGGATISDAAPEWAKAAVARANSAGGWTVDNYKEAVYALGCELVTNPVYRGVSEKAMTELVMKTVQVPGMEQQLFAGEVDPAAAYSAFLSEHVANIMSVRGDGEKVKQRVTEFFAGSRGYFGAPLPEDDGELNYTVLRACEDIGRYRMSGGNNWYEEQKLLYDTLEACKKEYQGIDTLNAYLKGQHAMDLHTQKVCEEKAKAWEGKVQQAQEKGKAELKMKQEKEKKPKKQTREELLKERPYLGETELHYKYKANGERRATLTVPVAEYREIARQFEKGDDDVLYCYINGGKTGLLVIPGVTDEWTVNRPAAHVLLNGRKNNLEEFADGLKKGKHGLMQIKRVRKVGNK